MAAVLLTVIVSSTPPSGVLAAVPGLAGPAVAGAVPHTITTSAPASRPLSSRAAIAFEAVALDSRASSPLPVEPYDAWTLDSPARRPEPPPALAAAAPSHAAAPAHIRATARAPVRAARRPAKLWAQLHGGLTVTGLATWYFGTRGYAGIPHVAMPGARYLTRGRITPQARVCVGTRCTVVRVVDACACSLGTRQARVVDLSVTALVRLGLDPRRGVYQVRVTLLVP